MPDPSAEAPAPVVYVSDLTYDDYDPADLFDLAFLLRSPDHDLRAVVLTRPDADGERILDALSVRARKDIVAAGTLDAALTEATEPVNLVVVGGFGIVDELLTRDRPLFRAKVARLFLIGGQANDYANHIERLAINPRLRERNPEHFASTGDPRVPDAAAFGRLLTSGEGVIWLPRDICLWRYAAPGILDDGGSLASFLLRELAAVNTRVIPDRYDAADAPALLSSAPALLLARRPDPFAWMRLFRAMPARVETDDSGGITTLTTQTESPNLYIVIAIDGQALGKLVTARLRDRPLSTPND